jgi:hypothetical protein
MMLPKLALKYSHDSLNYDIEGNHDSSISAGIENPYHNDITDYVIFLCDEITNILMAHDTV